MLGHTLLTGITGSGKSYTEKKMIQYLIDSHARMVLIDPKRVELGSFKQYANMYACEADDIEHAIRFAFIAMETRLEKMEKEAITEFQGAPMYLIIDEVLPITSNKAMHKNGTLHYLEQIAFLGRAAKVFLVLCTQCPTRQYLPPLIKVNLPDIVCLRQKDRRDYRYVLDQNVEPLKGKYGECYIIKDGEDIRRMSTDDAIKLIMEG